MTRLYIPMLFCLAAGLLVCGPAGAQSSVTMDKLLKYPKYTFRDTVRLEGVPRDEMYARALNWFDEQAKAEPHFVEEASQRHGRFVGTSSLKFQSKIAGGNDFVKGHIFFLVRVHVHSDYYVYEFTDFVHQGRLMFNTITTAPRYPYRPLAGKEWHDLVWEEMKLAIKDHTYPLVGGLRASMQKESARFTEILTQYNSETPLEALHNAEVPNSSAVASGEEKPRTTPRKSMPVRQKAKK